ncbi:hypothetical protein F4604DRAFT_1908659 [Suillus subluteus]|nr:hypothetical protein F4604DRAFT_1908659 [Suillus subluteus]
MLHVDDPAFCLCNITVKVEGPVLRRRRHASLGLLGIAADGDSFSSYWNGGMKTWFSSCAGNGLISWTDTRPSNDLYIGRRLANLAKSVNGAVQLIRTYAGGYVSSTIACVSEKVTSRSSSTIFVFSPRELLAMSRATIVQKVKSAIIIIRDINATPPTGYSGPHIIQCVHRTIASTWTRQSSDLRRVEQVGLPSRLVVFGLSDAEGSLTQR